MSTDEHQPEQRVWFDATIQLLLDEQYQHVIESYEATGPSGVLDLWLVYCSLLMLHGESHARAFADLHRLHLPPDELVKLLSRHFNFKNKQLLAQVLRAISDPEARAARLVPLVAELTGGSPDVRWWSMLLQAQLEAGDIAGLDHTATHPGLSVEGEGLSIARVAALVNAVREGRVPFDVAASAVQMHRDVLRRPYSHLYVAIALVLAGAARRQERAEDALTWGRAALEDAQTLPYVSDSAEPLIFSTVSTITGESYGIEVGAPPAWSVVVDTIIDDAWWPADVRGQALLFCAELNADEETAFPDQDDVGRARELLGDTHWVCRLRSLDHPLEYLLNFKTWMGDRLEHLDEYSPGWPDVPPIPDGLTLTRDEALSFHDHLMRWEDVPSEHRTTYDDVIARVRLTAWESGTWRSVLLPYQLHREAAEAARVVLDLMDDVRTRLNAAFALGYHAVQTQDPAWLDEGVGAYRQALTLAPNDANVLNNLALAVERQGHIEEAVGLLEQAVARSPTHDHANANLARLRRDADRQAQRQYGIELRFKQGSSEAARDFAQAYWRRTPDGWAFTTKHLQDRSNLTTAKQRDAATEAGWACSTTRLCQDCATPYVYRDRREFEIRPSVGQGFVCVKCTRGREAQAQDEQARIDERRRQVIRHTYDLKEVPALNLDALTLEDAVYLVSVVRVGAAEDLRSIHPLETLKEDLGPTPDFSVAMVRRLYQREVLRIHPASVPSAFTWKGETIEGVDLRQVHWGIAAGGQQLPFGSLIELLDAKLGTGPEGWSTEWVREVPELWRAVTLAEAVRYLLHCLHEHRFEFSPGEKTLLVLRTVLEGYSLAQVWSIIWSRSKDAAALYQRQQMSRQHAANSVITGIKNYAERARAEGWTVRASRRNFDTPLPMVAQVLFTRSLGLGIAYQEQLPPPLEPV